MFYFYDPLINTTQTPVTPPAMSRVVETPVRPALPKGWQWASSKSSSAVAPGTAAGGDEDSGKKGVLSSPSAAPTVALAGYQPLPTWSIVSWRNLAPRSITGTREEAISQVESDLATAGVHHLDIRVYAAVHTIVALKAEG